jgi:hypothetical protein
MTAMSPLESAIAYFTITALAKELFADWKEPKRGTRCRCPYRKDNNPSFSIFAGRRLARDFTEGKTFNVIGFLMRALGLSRSDAAKELIRRYRTRCGDAATPAVPPSVVVPERQRDKRPILPRMDEGSPAERLALARLRHVSPEAVELLIDRGMIRFCWHRGYRCWVITDSTRRAAQPRRLDGHLWRFSDGSESKVVSFTDSNSKWPCGIHDACRRKRVAIVEGAGDGLAAAHFAIQSGCAEDVGIVVRLGARLPIPAECIPFFAGSSIRLFIDRDKAGEDGAQECADQLVGVAAHVDGVGFKGFVRCDGKPVKDLNDLCLVSPDCFEARRAFIEGIMSF